MVYSVKQITLQTGERTMNGGPEKNYVIGQLFDLYGELLTGRQKDVVDLYYNDDLSLSEVAAECGITRQGVRDALVKAEAQLTACEERLGLLKKQKETEEALRGVIAGLEALASSGADTAGLIEKLSALL